MALRFQPLFGLLFTLLAGCQSFSPYGHSAPGMYPSMPPGSFGPPATSAVPSPGRATIRSGQQPGQPLGQPAVQAPGGTLPAGPGGGKQVPRYSDPDPGPANLGTPDLDDEDIIPRDRGGASYRESSLAPLDEAAADEGAVLAGFGEEAFAAPRRVQPIDDTVAGDEMPQQVRKTVRSPYLRDSSGQYAWLRGTVSRDPRGAGWRLKYNDDPLDADDEYGGEILLTGHKRLELLVEGDVVLAYGEVTRVDGMPVYQVQNVVKLKPRP